ncbi:MAG: glycosyltransferase family 39 protein [Candidatus Eremiobacteraeota bacterium]|nr:glycosyltransferase family 39 protein [Candidatus Eremiobacteraeota bacterium]
MGSPETEKKKESFISRYWHVFLISAILILFALQNYNFISKNTAPPYADSTHHLTLARKYHSFIFEKNFDIRNAPLHQKYPPLKYVVASVFMAIFGVSIQSAMWSYFLYVVILTIALYGIGSYFGGKIGGVVTALIALSCHFIMYMAHMFVPELPQASMTALAFYFLLKSEKFSNQKYVLAFALAFALSMITKWSSAFYMAAPILIVIIYLCYRNLKSILIVIVPTAVLSGLGVFYLKTGMKLYQLYPGGNMKLPSWMFPVFIATVGLFIVITILLEKNIDKLFKEENRKHAKSLLIGMRALLISLLIFGLWYVYSIHGVISKLKLQQQEIFRPGPQHLRNVPLLIYSLKQYATMNGMFPIPYYAMLLVGVAFIFIRKQKFMEFAMLIFMGIVGVLIISSTAPPAIFYILTVWVILSTLAGYWVGYAGKLKYPLLAFTIMFAVFSLCLPWTGLAKETCRPLLNRTVYEIGLGFISDIVPDTHEYYIDNLLEELDKKADIVRQKEMETGDPEMAKYIPLTVYFTRKFREPLTRKTGMLEREAFLTALTYRDTKGFFYFYLDDNDWGRRFQEFSQRPIFIIVGYVDPDYPKSLKTFIEEEYGRESRVVSTYTIDENRKIMLIQIK